MLSGNESISHYTKQNVALWMTMALQAGLINIGGFMACHRFVSHVTGFATFLGYEVAQMQIGPALGMLTVPLFFLFGSMISGQLVDVQLRAHQKPRYYVVFGIVFLLVLTALIGGVTGVFGAFGKTSTEFRDTVLLALLCLTCGIQNGTVTSVSKSVIRTTHLTGITTDLGIGLARVLNRKNSLYSLDDDVRANLMRVGIIVFFGMGSVLGAFAFAKFGYLGFVAPALTSGSLFGIVLYFQVLKARPQLPHTTQTKRGA